MDRRLLRTVPCWLEAFVHLVSAMHAPPDCCLTPTSPCTGPCRTRTSCCAPFWLPYLPYLLYSLALALCPCAHACFPCAHAPMQDVDQLLRTVLAAEEVDVDFTPVVSMSSAGSTDAP